MLLKLLRTAESFLCVCVSHLYCGSQLGLIDPVTAKGTFGNVRRCSWLTRLVVQGVIPGNQWAGRDAGGEPAMHRTAPITKSSGPKSRQYCGQEILLSM